MSDILQIFTGNPLTTFIGKKIEAATRPDLETDDWALNMEICDLINDNDDDAKDAVRSIRKRLQQIEQDRNFTVTNRTLTVLETCVSNCSHRFHVHVMNKDFIQDLVKLIGPKNNPPIELQERVLRLIQRWANAFMNQPDLSGVVTVYNDLKAKGLTFPPADSGPNVPIQTPQRSVAPPVPRPGSITRNDPQLHMPPTGPIVLEGEGYEKITHDLQVVKTSIEMFTEVIELLEKGSPDLDLQLATDLNSTCNQMRDRIVDLIERISNEDLTIELLRLNDDLNNLFTRYRRARSKYKPRLDSRAEVLGSIGNPSATRSNPYPRPTGSHIESSRPADSEPSLIDFGAEDPNIGKEDIVDPFAPTTSSRTESSSIKRDTPESVAKDMSRLKLNSEAPKSRVKDSAFGALPDEISSLEEQDFAEIENWLSSDTGQEMASGADRSAEPTSMVNPEFDKFIANRALAGSSNRSPDSTAHQAKSDISKPEPSV